MSVPDDGEGLHRWSPVLQAPALVECVARTRVEGETPFVVGEAPTLADREAMAAAPIGWRMTNATVDKSPGR